MAQLLTRMEQNGLIRRKPSREDGRSSTVMLTDHAEALLEPVREALRLMDEMVCASLSAKDWATLLRLLFQIADEVEKINSR